jgi:high-affinity nickel-transport protein
MAGARIQLEAGEGVRLGGLAAAVLGLHALGWGLFALHSHDFGSAYVGAGALAYGLGLRHAFDADHISAIDDSTRLLVQRGQKPLGVGLFFSLGHSSVVFLLCAAVAFGARATERYLPALREVGGLVGTVVSGGFLWLVGLFNLAVFVGMWRLWRTLRSRPVDGPELDALLAQRGFLNRLFGQRLWNLISKSWHLYPVGFLFGLGFDTASEVGLLALTAAATSRSGADGRLPVLGILALPLLFAAGMAMMDTADGALMSKAYRWALSSPSSKVYYNLITTGLSALVALGVGTVELVQVLGKRLHLESAFFVWLYHLDFEVLGYAIVALFVVVWAGSVAAYKWLRLGARAATP